MNGSWFGLGIGGGVVAGLGMAIGLVAMEASSGSAFCGSCHVMKKYHASWSNSTHREVGCVECHIPPGFEAKLEKKLEGLTMLARTMTGSISSHISARVSDEVCLKCHERRLLVGSEWFDEILFDHRPHLAELRRGVRLTCSSCHSQIVQGSHITVTGSSCLVCHFMKREANERETECSLCHQVEGMLAERNGRRFDHTRAIELDVRCDACHAPRPMEVGAVPRERCLTCHSRPERLEKYGDIHAMVETHVNESRALCNDCHRELQHVGERHEGPDPARCSGCHEPRRSPQLNLYTGLGRDMRYGTASPMYSAGVRCEACHVETPGMTAEPANERACLACHPLGVERLFGWWMEAADERQVLARKLFEETAAELGASATVALAEADRQIALVERGHGVHNLVLSMTLLDTAVDDIAAARDVAGLAPRPPPWPRTMPATECLRCHRGTETRSMTSFGRDFGHEAHFARASLECERCHSRHEQRRSDGVAPLLFGQSECQGCHHEQIDTETCASCHDDLHRAQFAGARCDECHVAESWVPAPGFDHHSTAYPLTGGHRRAACAECHLGQDAGGTLVVRYRGVAHERCEDCHEDSHAAKLGPSCDSCHVTDSWRRVDRAAFDHQKTSYPLLGRHQSVGCERCHPPGRPSRAVESEACSDCHRDEHLGQFAALDAGAACEPCHSVWGFLPTTFSPDHHGETGFELSGAHRAVPCDRCHQRISTSELFALAGTAAPPYHTDTADAAVQFSFSSTECDVCHQDPHNGTVDDFMRERGCEACHDEESWRGVAFDHRLESFPLEGRHREVACGDCHPRRLEGETRYVQLRGVPRDCAGCHENPHAAAAALGSRTDDCERCHTADDWRTTAFDHRRDARFPLVAAHTEAACGSCHADLRYESTPAACRDCHTDPHRGELGLSCERCHTPHSWTHNVEALITHSATLFPLEGSHATLDCGGCHTREAPFEYASTPTECYECHAEEYATSSRPDHQLLALSTRCEDCHDSHSWAGAKIDPALALDHDAVFALAGAHREADCDSCHTGGYAGTPRDCVGCHLDEYTATVEPDHRLAALPTDCTVCHSQEDWARATWSHSAVFDLEGAHRGLDCVDCHAGGYGGTTGDCHACHADDYAGAEPDHRAAGFTTECSACHNQRRWDRTRFDHQGDWPLTGAHRGLECAACHADGYLGVSSDCYACHRRDYRQVTDPDHRAAGFAVTCEDCHGTATWSGARLDHDLVFALRGAHRTLDCVDCHATGYTGTSRDCVGCHLDDYNGVRDPDHRAAAFSTDCIACHSTDSWQGAAIDHQPTFPLTGAHRGLDCVECHSAGYIGTPSGCAGCHDADYRGTADPDHLAADLPTDCESCHTTEQWPGAAFDHARWTLTGGHVGVGCRACHATTYAGTSTDCYTCHRAEYESARDHSRVGMPTDCGLCHSTDRWRGAVFEHGRTFALTGAHTGLACGACHAGGYSLPRDCAGCHQTDYDSTRDPNHRAEGFARDCTVCHDTGDWHDVALDHNPLYPLTGAHTTVDCAGCHAGGYAGTPAECSGCHLDDYDAALDPEHRTAGFPRDCTTCHTTDRWLGASFSHDPYYLLTGTHTRLTCVRCHEGGFAGTPRECVGCHLDSYEEARIVDHQAAQFQTTCEDCHSTYRWLGAQFREHDIAHFPIYSGTHQTWGSCRTCHRVIGDYRSFSCTICHNHRRDKMDRVHLAVVGYEFDSVACLACHPTGQAP